MIRTNLKYNNKKKFIMQIKTILYFKINKMIYIQRKMK